MDLKRPNKLRLSGSSEAETTGPDGGSGLRAPFPVNEVAELVADLLESSGLIRADKLAAIRGRVKQGGSFSQALLDEGAASPEGIARTLASRFHLPFVDLPVAGISEEAAKELPIHVMERVVAVPYALEGDTLRVAVADPGNVHAIDELRLATRFQLELAVASGEDIENEIRRLLRASEAFGARAAVEEDDSFLGQTEEEEADDLEVDDGISDVPLVRLVNSIIFQAAEDGASDIHFEPQEDALAVRLRIDGVLHEVQRIPRRMMAGVTTRLKVISKLDIAERRRPQDGRISLTAAAAGRMRGPVKNSRALTLRTPLATMTIASPSTVGSVATRMSSIRPAVAAFSEMRPSCGLRRSAMSSFASTFRRVVTPASMRLGIRCCSVSTPSTRVRTMRESPCGSKWMSLAPSLAACMMIEFTRRTSGASETPSSASRSSPSSSETTSNSSIAAWVS